MHSYIRTYIHTYIHLSEPSLASRTNLLNLTSLQWDENILQDLKIPSSLLPEIKPSANLFGYFDGSYAMDPNLVAENPSGEGLCMYVLYS